MKRSAVIQISAVNFLQFFILGSTVPVMSLYLKEYLKFSGVQIGLILSMSAASSIVTPLLTAFIADKKLSSERLLAVLYFSGSILMFFLRFQSGFIPFLFLFLFYMMSVGPTTSLIQSITFHHLGSGRESYGKLRVWGTIGWITVAWGFGYFWLNSGHPYADISTALTLSCVASFLFALFALTIPKHRKDDNPEDEKMLFLNPSEAFMVFKNKNIRIAVFLIFLTTICDRFYFFGTAPFLNSGYVKEQLIMPLMSFGQITEIFSMMILGILVRKIGVKKILMLGIFSEMMRFLIFFFQAPLFLTLIGIGFHGAAYAWTIPAVSIFLDRKCVGHNRTATHQIFYILTYGIGSLAGNNIAGRVLDLSENFFHSGFSFFWFVPFLLSSIVLILTVLLFKPSVVVNTADESG